MKLGVELVLHRCTALAVLGCAAVLPSHAADVLPGGPQQRLQFEVSTSALPRLDGEAGSRDSRVDFLILPLRPNSVGLSFGINNRMPGLTALPLMPGVQATSVDLGLHWRYTLDSTYRVDITAWRRTPVDAMSLIESRDPSYGARVELPMGSTSMAHGFVADKGFVGVQLEGGARITVKRSRGVPMVYYRNTF
jgi:hypothetical protein